MIRQAAAFILVLAGAFPIGAQQAQPAPQTPPVVRTPESERERWNQVFTIKGKVVQFLAQKPIR
jgi:hypothetical protein